MLPLKPTRSSFDHERENWITRKYQQLLFVPAAKGHVQYKVEKADHSTVRKSGVKKHIWLPGWAIIKDDRLEVYSDYPPKVGPSFPISLFLWAEITPFSSSQPCLCWKWCLQT